MRAASSTWPTASGSPGGRRGVPRELEGLKRRPCVAARAARDLGRDVVRHVGRQRVGPARDHTLEILERQRLQLDHGAAREERLVDLEVRVLRRRPDQRDEAVLDRVEHRILLALVEAVDLVDEQQRPHAVAAEPVASAGDHRTHVVDPGGHGGQLLERRRGALRDDPRDRRLPHARRPVEDHRRRAALRDRPAERRSGADDVLLADELVERPRPHRGARAARCARPARPRRRRTGLP